MRKFDIVFRGYDKVQVQKCLDEVAKNYESLLNKSKQTEIRNTELLKELEHYKSLESTLNRAIFTAESACDKIKKMARNEADTLLSEAKRNANRIINDALIKAEKVQEQADRTHRNVEVFKRRLRTIIESQLEVISEIEDIDLKRYDE